MCREIIAFLCFSLLTPAFLFGQEKKDWGKLSGSLETNMGLYFKDDVLNITKPDHKFAINTWLMLGYSIRKFRFGVQYELYEPPLAGYSTLLKGNKLMQGFAEYQGDCFAVRLGSIYEQFGSGIMFRAYEERAIGFNNSILGGNVSWRPFDFLTVKAFAGVPRKFLKYANTRVYGVDGELGVLDLFGASDKVHWSIGGGWVLRDSRSVSEYKDAPSTIRLYAGRTNLNWGVLSLGGEYTIKSNSLAYSPMDGYILKKGSALLLNLGVDMVGIGISAEFRRLENMDFRIDDKTGEESVSLNYLPALTKQHKYTLASLYPHQFKAPGEIGGQMDIFGELPEGCLGDKPLKFTFNGAFYKKLAQKGNGDYAFWDMGDETLFREIGMELERKWGKKMKGILSFVSQQQSVFSLLGNGQMKVNSQILIGDFLYKLTPRHSLRMELQHMWSDSDADKGWVMGLLEYGWAPQWMFYVSDYCNYNTTQSTIQYYTVGSSFTWESLRASFSYSRNRAGYQCAGGVCRYVPDYSGCNFTLTWTL